MNTPCAPSSSHLNALLFEDGGQGLDDARVLGLLARTQRLELDLESDLDDVEGPDREPGDAPRDCPSQGVAEHFDAPVNRLLL